MEPSSHFSLQTVPSVHAAEQDLLLLCARASVEGEERTKIRELCQAVDWDQLLLTASRHGLLGLLHKRLTETCADAVPESSLEFLGECSRRIAERNHYLSEVMNHISSRFQEAGIAAVPFGDIILVGTAYGDFSLRECKNLEFVIADDDLAKGRTLVESEGYRREYTWDGAREAAELRFRRTVGFDRNEDGIHLWFYPELDPGCCARALSFESLQPTRPVAIGDRIIKTLCPEDLLLHACLKLSEAEKAPALVLLADISRVIEHQPIDWPRLLQRARWLGVQRRLLAGLLLAKELLGAEIPETVRSITSSDRGAAPLAAEIRNRFFPVKEPLEKKRPRWVSGVRARERARDKARFLWRSAVTPTREDWSLLPLPAALYYVLKPIRVLGSRAGLLSRKRLAVYMPTPVAVAEEMLKLAEVGPQDTVYDLGCGDGRIVILAAKRHGARGVGVDLDPDRIRDATANARAAGVEHLVSFRRGDVMTVELASASVVSLFLSPQANLMLRAKLKTELPAHARIVSRSHDMGDWPPDKSKLVACDGALSRIHLWRIDGAAATDPH